jgi:hypothetical protein
MKIFNCYRRLVSYIMETIKTLVILYRHLIKTFPMMFYVVNFVASIYCAMFHHLSVETNRILV